MKTSYLFKHLSGSLLFFVILFVGAGTLDYWQGWVYVAIGLVMFTLNYTFLKIDPGLLEERFLQEELKGYPEYTRKTRYRMIPWIW